MSIAEKVEKKSSSRTLALPNEERLVKMVVQTEPTQVAKCANQVSRFLGMRDAVEWGDTRSVGEFKVKILRKALTEDNELVDGVRAYVWNAVRDSGPTYDMYLAARIAWRAAFVEWVRGQSMEEFGEC